MSRATLNIIGANDDLRTVVRKVNDNFRALNKDINITEINSGGEGTRFHNELLGREEFKCHPILSISGLQESLESINNKIDVINTSISQIDEKINEIENTLEDHERRIQKLENE